MKRRLHLPAPVRRAKDLSRHLRRAPLTAQLAWANRISRASLLAPRGPAVCLTTHGARLAKVHLTIESIGAGHLLPSRLILWLDDPTALAELPDALRRLLRRGLEIHLCGNHGPHTKYYPYVATQPLGRLPMVTADDDMLYPRHWLSTLMQAHTAQPAIVHAWRAKVVPVTADGIAPYGEWRDCGNTRPSLRHFAEGVSGVIYPTRLLAALRDAGEGFITVCPRADDVWLHAQALRAGIRVRQLHDKARDFPCIPGTEAMGLMHGNVAGQGNDEQIRCTYQTDDLRRLLEEPGD